MPTVYPILASSRRAALALALLFAGAHCTAAPVAAIRVHEDRPLAPQVDALSYLPADTTAVLMLAHSSTYLAAFTDPALPRPYALPELAWAPELRPYIDERAPMGVALWDASAMVVVWFAAVTDARAAGEALRRHARQAGARLVESRSGKSRILSAPDAGWGVVGRGPWMFVIASPVSSRREALEVRIANLPPDRGLRAQPAFITANAELAGAGGADAAVYIDGPGIARMWLARTSEPSLGLADLLSSLGSLAARANVSGTALEFQLGARFLEHSLLDTLTAEIENADPAAPGQAAPERAGGTRTVHIEGTVLATQLLEYLGQADALPAIPDLPEDENRDVPFSPEYRALVAEYTALRERAGRARESLGRFAAARAQRFGEALGSARLSLTRAGDILRLDACLDFDAPGVLALYQSYVSIARELAAEIERTRDTLEDLARRARALHVELVRVRARDVQAWDLR